MVSLCPDFQYFSMLPTLMRRRNLIAFDCLVNDLCNSVTLVCLKKEPPEFTALSYGLVEMSVSENSAPINPMVNDHYPY